MRLDELFRKGLENHHLANYAYPIKLSIFKDYQRELSNSEVLETWSQADRFSVYVHVPFCKQRCKFCDYTVLGNPSESQVKDFVDCLLGEIEMYRPLLESGKPIVGFDVGGGTPAYLHIGQLESITSAISSHVSKGRGLVQSIETTPAIAAAEPEKLAAIRRMGYNRMSMGVQAVSRHVLDGLRQSGNGRSRIVKAVQNIQAAGFDSVNLDLMYGFPDQGTDDWLATLQFTVDRAVTDITLYRLHFKSTAIEGRKDDVTLEDASRLYDTAFDFLTTNGYCASYGQNTFSKNPSSFGLSSYLKERSLYGTPYLGLGLGAQSMLPGSLSYNCGKRDKRLDSYCKNVYSGKFPIQDFYVLPVGEMLAKSIAVSFYSGGIDLYSLSNRYSVDVLEHFSEEIVYLLDKGLMGLNDNTLRVTRKGLHNMNGIIPLFYSEKSKSYLLAL